MKNGIIIASVFTAVTLALVAWAVSADSKGTEDSSTIVQPTKSGTSWSPPGNAGRSMQPAQLTPVASLVDIASERGLDTPVIPEPGVKYGRLADQHLPGTVQDSLHASLQRLRDTGSLSGGKVTHEFASVEDASRQLREWGLGHLLGALAITPTNLAPALGDRFTLVGADASGKEIPGRGRAAFYQVWRSGTNQWVELAEDQLDVLGGDGTVVNADFHNETIDKYPATLESLQDREGASLLNVQWWIKERSFFLTTRNMNKDETIALALRVSRNLESLPHDGWRTAYEFDPENPAHRLVRSRQLAHTPVAASPR